MSHNGKINGKKLIHKWKATNYKREYIILRIMATSIGDIRVGSLCKICISKNWKAAPFGFNVETKKQGDIATEEVCLVVQLSPHWNSPVSELWARVLIGETMWDIHTDYLMPIESTK